jgi:cytidine deaminase
MKPIQKTITIEEYSTLTDLSLEEQELLQHARTAASNAYAPYSNFFVGCALHLEDGSIVLGNNQENAAYPSGMCAERTALYFKGANVPHAKIKMMAITAQTDLFSVKEPIYPCGACRQVISEYEHLQKEAITIIMQGQSGVIHKVHSSLDLLPFSFNSSHLNI